MLSDLRPCVKQKKPPGIQLKTVERERLRSWSYPWTPLAVAKMISESLNSCFPSKWSEPAENSCTSFNNGTCAISGRICVVKRIVAFLYSSGGRSQSPSAISRLYWCSFLLHCQTSYLPSSCGDPPPESECQVNVDFGCCSRSAPNSAGSGPGIVTRTVSLSSESRLPELDWSISRMMAMMGLW